MIDKWYSYRDFRFSRDQIKWALANIVTLRNGQWPPEHRESGYVGEEHKKRIRTEGNFVRASLIAAEIDLRLTKAGLNGLLLLAIYGWGETETSLAKYFGVSEWVIQRRRRQALAFVAGWKRKVK